MPCLRPAGGLRTNSDVCLWPGMRQLAPLPGPAFLNPPQPTKTNTTPSHPDVQATMRLHRHTPIVASAAMSLCLCFSIVSTRCVCAVIDPSGSPGSVLSVILGNCASSLPQVQPAFSVMHLISSFVVVNSAFWGSAVLEPSGLSAVSPEKAADRVVGAGTGTASWVGP